MQKYLLRFFIRYAPVIFIAVIIVLGLVQPGYNHFRHSISRLAIGQYGWILNLNLILLGIYLQVIGYKLSKYVKPEYVKSIKIIFSAVGLLCLITALFPTDLIEDSKFNISSFSIPGAIHSGPVVLFVFASPLIIRKLYRILRTFRNEIKFAQLTLHLGIVIYLSCMIWFIFYYFAVIPDYRGLFQKILVTAVLIWIMKLGHLLTQDLPA